MSLTAIAFWVVLLLLAGYAVVLYNGLVRLKHAVGKAWANIDVLLKQRHDELPKLVEACKQYMQHERATLERVIAARNAVASARERADVNALGKAESGLRAGLGSSSRWPRITRSSRPTKVSSSFPSASAAWRTGSPIAASCTTRR